MRYILPLFAIIIFFAAGCGKAQVSPESTADCSQAEYPFACYLDKAMIAKDPNLCNQNGISRVTCLTAYEEIMESSVSCNDLSDAFFRQECEDYKAWQAANTPEPPDDSASGLIINTFGDQ